jgi:6,7-dimethyl-8-ribityllumazine synthase
LTARGELAKSPGTPAAGDLDGAGLRFALVCSRFNGFVTEMLLAGACDGLRRYGAADGDVTVLWVPGAFEIPFAAQRLAASGAYHAIVALGAVIRGETGHYDLVAGQCAAGVQRVQLDTGVPVVFGVLTTETVDQAVVRADPEAGNKGGEAAATAVEMASLSRRL